jgi:hypothetical protein
MGFASLYRVTAGKVGLIGKPVIGSKIDKASQILAFGISRQFHLNLPI